MAESNFVCPVARPDEPLDAWICTACGQEWPMDPEPAPGEPS
jgi:hypothetical protein